MTDRQKLSDISDAERETRIDLAAAFRLVDMYGWSDLASTHLSARVPDAADQFLINPFGMLFQEITVSSLVKVDGDANILSETDYGINPAGFTVHNAVHLSGSDALWAIHTHTEAGCAVATQKDGLLPLTQHALAVLGHTGYHGRHREQLGRVPTYRQGSRRAQYLDHAQSWFVDRRSHGR